jgi:serine protease Do
MLSRSSALILSLTSMSAGLLLGIVLARGGPAVSAQVAGTARAELKAADTSPAPSKASSQARRDDEAVYDALARQYESFRQIDRTFELVAKSVSPTVVHIVAKKSIRVEEGRRVRQFDETGSGVIVRSDRLPGLYVLTNHHVVENAKPAKIQIFLRDGRSHLPVRIWSDEMADIAVMKLDRDDLPAARMGNSDDAVVGTWVMALGSPFGLTHSVSQGIISARSRHMEELEDVKNQDFLQTDAAINPGNSGGPLVNMRGEVIGINNSIASNGGGNEGVGFSIPINLARWIMNELIVHGRVNRGGLGVSLETGFSPEDALKLGIEQPRGARLREVYPASPALRAGLRVGDVVLRFGGVDINDLNHLINTVSMSPIGQSAEIVVWRDGREQTFRVTVEDRKNIVQFAEGAPEVEKDPTGLLRRPDRPGSTSSVALGMELATLTPELAVQMALPESWRGAALIVRVDPDSPLARHVHPRDIITSIDNHAIQSAEQAAAILNQRADHARLTINFGRLVNGQLEPYTIRLP